MRNGRTTLFLSFSLSVNNSGYHLLTVIEKGLAGTFVDCIIKITFIYKGFLAFNQSIQRLLADGKGFVVFDAFVPAVEFGDFGLILEILMVVFAPEPVFLLVGILGLLTASFAAESLIQLLGVES